MQYECEVCGYIYDPAEHDGVEFSALDEFNCPLCGVDKDKFHAI